MGPPQSVDDEKYLQVVAWNSGGGKPKRELHNTRQLDEVIDALNLLDISTLSFTGPGDLLESIVRYTTPFMDVNQRLRIEGQHDLFVHRDVSIHALAENGRAIRDFDRSLDGTLYHVRARIERDERHIARIRLSFVDRVWFPLFIDAHPDVALRAEHLTVRPAVLARLREVLEGAIAQCETSPEAAAAVRRVFYTRFVNQMDAFLRADGNAPLLAHYGRLVANFTNEHGYAMKHWPQARVEIVTAATQGLTRLGGEMNITTTLRFVARVMLEARALDDSAIAIAIARSANLTLRAVQVFLSAFLLQQPEIMEIVLDPGHVPPIQRFSKVLALIQPRSHPIPLSPDAPL
jgi:hypothetical protein